MHGEIYKMHLQDLKERYVTQLVQLVGGGRGYEVAALWVGVVAGQGFEIVRRVLNLLRQRFDVADQLHLFFIRPFSRA
jgi:hypothetical protein